ITAELTPVDQRPGERPRLKQRIQHWQVGTGVISHEVGLEFTPDFMQFATFSADGKLFVCNDQTKGLCFWDSSSGKLRLQIAQALTHDDPPVLSADGSTLAVVAADSQLYAYELTKGKELHQFQPEEEYSGPFAFRHPALSPDGKTLVVSTPTSL